MVSLLSVLGNVEIDDEEGDKGGEKEKGKNGRKSK